MGKNSDDYFVEGAQAIERRVYLRNRLRALWKNRAATNFCSEFAALAEKLFVSKSFLQTEFNGSQTFGGMLEKVERHQHRVGAWTENYPLVTVEKALFDLRQILERTRREKGGWQAICLTEITGNDSK